MENSGASRACASLALGLLLVGTLGVGLRADWLPCTLDCGETYEAHVAARNLWRFGWANGGLQDFAASPDPVAHPTLYIHNPNLGMYTLAGLFALGLRSVHAQAALMVLPFALGMLYLGLAVAAICRNRLLGWLCVLQASSLYLLVVLWQFDALRVWAWLLTWGTVYHLVRWRGWHRGLAAVYLALGIAVDYPFGLFLACLAVACSALRLTGGALGRTILLAGGAVGAAILLRQLQVASVLGPAVWWADVSMSVLRRLPLTAALGPVQDPASFALTHSLVVWPGGGGPMHPVTWLWVIIRAHLAAVGWPLLLLGGVWIWAVAHRRSLEDPLRRAVDLSLALASALSVTFLVFGEYMAAFYGLYLMPLVVHWIILVLGVTGWWLWTHRTLRWRAVPVGMLLLLAFVGWRGAVEARNVWTLPPVGYPGREALAEYPGASVATLWISSAPSAYTDQWAARVMTMRWLVPSPGRFTFDRGEYFTFFERDRENPMYRQPDLLLVPRLHTWGLARSCLPLAGMVTALADGCSDLRQVELALAQSPLIRRGANYLLYDLRAARTSKLDTTPPDGLSSGH